MIDKKYNELVNKILTEGKEKMDRTGTGTISIFNAQIEHNMSDGFPLLTCKKMYVRGIIHELLWFLNGDTNIRPLVMNGVNIWTPDAYKKYVTYAGSLEEPDYDVHVDDPNQNVTRLMTIEEFSDRVCTDNEFADKFGALGPIYGKQWVNWGDMNKIPVSWNHGAPTHHKEVGINQIQEAIDSLKNNPDSRRIMVSAWNVSDISSMTLPPCHWSFELYTEELTPLERFTFHCESKGLPVPKLIPTDGEINLISEIEGIPSRRLSLKWHQRSVDFGLGLPFNIASYGLLLHMFAQQCNMVPDKLIGDLTNVHIYKNHIDIIKELLSREPYQLPTLVLNKAKDIFSYNYEDFTIKNYKSHPILKMPISV